jgi:hypothetical protein
MLSVVLKCHNECSNVVPLCSMYSTQIGEINFATSFHVPVSNGAIF